MRIQYDSNGDGWEVDAIYEFSYGCGDWYAGRLSGLEKGGYHFATGCKAPYIRECENPAIGKTHKKHKKPVELIEGEWYKFDNSQGMSLFGYYGSVSNDPGGRASRNGFCVGTTGVATFYTEEDCIGITHMIEAPTTDK